MKELGKFLGLLLLFASMTSSVAHAQLGLGNVLRNLLPHAGGGSPITTSLRDARWGDPSRDGFVPPVPKQSIFTLPRTPSGGFVLRAGYWSYHAQSYCLHAGTHGPGGGDGYLFAPVKGPARDAVVTILRNSVAHPEIRQQTIQSLIWAILARAKFEDLNSQLASAAAQLLDQQQLLMLNRTALDILPQGMLERAVPNLSPLLRQIAQSEATIRRLVTSSGSDYAQLERAAVLAGFAPPGPGSIHVPSGRWSDHPGGYFVRYLPRSYRETEIEIWVPRNSGAIGTEFDPAEHVAVPGNTSRQRLSQSAREWK